MDGFPQPSKIPAGDDLHTAYDGFQPDRPLGILAGERQGSSLLRPLVGGGTRAVILLYRPPILICRASALVGARGWYEHSRDDPLLDSRGIDPVPIMHLVSSAEIQEALP